MSAQRRDGTIQLIHDAITWASPRWEGLNDVEFMSEAIMIHDASMGLSEGRLNDVEVEATELRRLTMQMYEMMSVNIGKKRTSSRRGWGSVNVDAYISCEEAHRLNLCTHVGVPKLQTTVEIRQQLRLRRRPDGGLAKPAKKRKRKKISV